MRKTYLDLSTGHLSRDTRNFLDKRFSQALHLQMGWPALTIACYPYGYFITVPNIDDADVIEQLKSVPQDLRACLFYAFQQGAELIRFDADGHVDGDLPYYQEI